MGADVDATASGEGAGMFSEGRVSLPSAFPARALVCEGERYPLCAGSASVLSWLTSPIANPLRAQISGTAAGDALHRPDSTHSTRRPFTGENARRLEPAPRSPPEDVVGPNRGPCREPPAEEGGQTQLGVLTSQRRARRGAARGTDRDAGGPSREGSIRGSEPGGRSRDSTSCRSSASARR